MATKAKKTRRGGGKPGAPRVLGGSPPHDSEEAEDKEDDDALPTPTKISKLSHPAIGTPTGSLLKPMASASPSGVKTLGSSGVVVKPLTAKPPALPTVSRSGPGAGESPLARSSMVPRARNSRVFIGNLASEATTENDLYAVFSKYGRLMETPVLRRSFGFVQFETPEAAANAISSEQGRSIGGMRVDLSLADNRELRRGAGDSGGGGGGGGGASSLSSRPPVPLPLGSSPSSGVSGGGAGMPQWTRGPKRRRSPSPVPQVPPPRSGRVVKGLVRSPEYGRGRQRPPSRNGIMVRVLVMGSSSRGYAHSVESSVRSSLGVNTDIIYIEACKLGEGLGLAGSNMIPYVIVVSSKDESGSTCTIRTLETSGYEKVGHGNGVIGVNDALDIISIEEGLQGPPGSYGGPPGPSGYGQGPPPNAMQQQGYGSMGGAQSYGVPAGGAGGGAGYGYGSAGPSPGSGYGAGTGYGAPGGGYGASNGGAGGGGGRDGVGAGRGGPAARGGRGDSRYGGPSPAGGTGGWRGDSAGQMNGYGSAGRQPGGYDYRGQSSGGSGSGYPDATGASAYGARPDGGSGYGGRPDMSGGAGYGRGQGGYGSGSVGGGYGRPDESNMYGTTGGYGDARHSYGLADGPTPSATATPTSAAGGYRANGAAPAPAAGNSHLSKLHDLISSMSSQLQQRASGAPSSAASAVASLPPQQQYQLQQAMQLAQQQQQQQSSYGGPSGTAQQQATQAGGGSLSSLMNPTLLASLQNIVSGGVSGAGGAAAAASPATAPAARSAPGGGGVPQAAGGYGQPASAYGYAPAASTAGAGSNYGVPPPPAQAGATAAPSATGGASLPPALLQYLQQQQQSQQQPHRGSGTSYGR